MKKTIDVLNSNREKLTIIRYSIAAEKLLSPKELDFIKSNILNDEHAVCINAHASQIALDFGLGSYALIDNLSILIPEPIIKAKIPFKHFLTFDQFPKFEETEDGKIIVIYPNPKAENTFMHAFTDILNM